jgi:cysteine synthase
MAETFSIERRRLMRFLGARVVVTPTADRAVGMINKTIALAGTHGWFMTRQFENEARLIPTTTHEPQRARFSRISQGSDWTIG